MIPIGMVLTWAGYGLASWGYVLVKGWNITLREWFSPLHPYQWPVRGDPPTIPKGHMFPTAQDSSTSASSPNPASAPGSGNADTRAVPGVNTA